MIDVHELRPCRRPTKSGTPCQHQIRGYTLACPVHLTEHERQLQEAIYHAVTHAGKDRWQRGYEHDQQVARVECERERRAAERAAGFRTELDGRQIITVNSGYSY